MACRLLLKATVGAFLRQVALSGALGMTFVSWAADALASPNSDEARDSDDAKDPDELRFRVGFAVGGSGPAQYDGRLRVVGPLFLQAGFFAVPHTFMANAGAIIEIPFDAAAAVYFGVGPGHVVSYAVELPEDCRPGRSCSNSSISYLHARLGLSFRPPRPNRRHIIGIDGGFWYGNWEDEQAKRPSGTFLIPMAGLSYHWAT